MFTKVKSANFPASIDPNSCSIPTALAPFCVAQSSIVWGVGVGGLSSLSPRLSTIPTFRAWNMFSLMLSVPRVTFTPESVILGIFGAGYRPVRALGAGQWAMCVPVSARISTSASSQKNQCAARTSGPSHPLSRR